MAAIEKLINRKVEQPGHRGLRAGPGGSAGNDSRSRTRRSASSSNATASAASSAGRSSGNRSSDSPSSASRSTTGNDTRKCLRPATSAYEDQVREARARMAAEGEPVPPQRPAAERGNAQRPGGSQQQRRRRGGRGNGAGRNARPEQWDPRRTEPREPAYAQHHKPNPARPVTVTQKKRSFAGLVGALLGRKPREEE